MFDYYIKENKYNSIYVLVSGVADTFDTEDLPWRLERHNKGWGRYTKRGIPWKIVYTEEFENKSDALKREREIKNRRSKIYIESLIKK